MAVSFGLVVDDVFAGLKLSRFLLRIDVSILSIDVLSCHLIALGRDSVG